MSIPNLHLKYLLSSLNLFLWLAFLVDDDILFRIKTLCGRLFWTIVVHVHRTCELEVYRTSQLDVPVKSKQNLHRTSELDETLTYVSWISLLYVQGTFVAGIPGSFLIWFAI